MHNKDFTKDSHFDLLLLSHRVAWGGGRQASHGQIYFLSECIQVMIINDYKRPLRGQELLVINIEGKMKESKKSTPTVAN